MLFTPVFDRSCRQVAWLIDNNTILGCDNQTGGSVQADHSVMTSAPMKHVGGFYEDKFKDKEGFVVAFVDRSFEKNEPSDHRNRVPPVVAGRIANWSMLTWEQYLNCS